MRAAALLFAVAAVARAEPICFPDEAPLFLCESDRPGKFIGICATEEKPGKLWTAVQYRFGKSDEAEMLYPADPTEGPRRLRFAHWREGDTYHVSVQFRSGGLSYRVHSEGQDDGAGTVDGTAGVIVTNAAGKVVNRIACLERPTLFAAYLHDALACDADGPAGKAACDATAPERPRADKR